MVGGFRLLPAGFSSCPSPPPGSLGRSITWGVRAAAGWRSRGIEGKGKMLSLGEGPASLLLLPLGSLSPLLEMSETSLCGCWKRAGSTRLGNP